MSIKRYFPQMVRIGVALLACCSFIAAAQCQPFEVVQHKQIRVVISADAKNEADDDFAVAHAVLTPTMKVKGLIAAHYARTAPMMKRDGENSMMESYNELQRLMKVMGKADVPIYRGAKRELAEGDKQTELSEGAQALIREALKEDSNPLFVLVMGPITDIAAALRAEPRIASRMTVVWIGGMPYPQGGWEYNMFNDPVAANEVFKSQVALWQVPHNVYMSVRVSLAELAARVKPQGETGEYLWRQLIDFNKMISAVMKDVPWPKSEVWVLGDNPSVSLLLDEHEYNYTLRDAPLLNDDLTYAPQPGARQIRVYNAVDARFTLEDFYAKLALTCGDKK
ncbi:MULTISPECIES: nucleoside hydrolase [Brenneria]|uniref:Nucleoside hydrolase n=1 Tax=Brenneria nigrifluens DSM 30175 = ATCC 13028 TaxID=1121120 RepID=A0A2U1US62_9GAMM|nr:MULTISPECIES: nucleoside hydrolase [Brenneria]EHD21099.1 Inosine/uridine-preferring nucleoside hydrolase [Brenneria sp. EniD312]PWC24519.1 nucleoside hydrolase [Brenneria nigrifluens] [Brenneria nigrifluens DSM 30175 = ATCC 13028]QCR04250.1 nucleoside hydrolase [Brenneria nigrifluens] [Brenneria nigrifluens DSM 30175 = ATCC 13028]